MNEVDRQEALAQETTQRDIEALRKRIDDATEETEDLRRDREYLSWVTSIVGHEFQGTFGDTYTCTGKDDNGFWMCSATRKANVSTRAIGRTFHRVRRRG